MNAEFSVAVHSLVLLHHRNCVLTSEQIAGNVCTNPARVRKVMARLKQAGYVSSREGGQGGYALVADAAHLSLQNVLEAMGGRAVEPGWKPGKIDMDCLVASGMANAMQAVYDQLDQACMRELARINIADIAQHIVTSSKNPHP